jgi:hypothetical protein
MEYSDDLFEEAAPGPWRRMPKAQIAWLAMVQFGLIVLLLVAIGVMGVVLISRTSSPRDDGCGSPSPPPLVSCVPLPSPLPISRL